MRSDPRPLALVLVLVLVATAGCAGDPPRSGGAPGPSSGGDPDPRAPAPAPDPELARLTARLRDYVYATYEVDQDRDEPALDRLRKAREALSAAMADAGMATRDQGLPSVVGALRDRFLASGDQVFVPIGGDAGGVLLVRVAARETRPERAVAGRMTGWRVVVFDEVLIEDVDGWRARAAAGSGAAAAGGAAPAPAPLRPVARASGKTIFVDRQAAQRLAREVVLPRAALAKGLEARAAKGEALSAAETKDLLRHRSLAPDIASGEAAVGRAIEREEELRTAAYIACAPQAASAAQAASAQDPADTIETERRAILVAASLGEPRYHLASALSAEIAAPGSPQAQGAEGALAAFKGRPLAAYSAEELRELAKRGSLRR